MALCNLPSDERAIISAVLDAALSRGLRVSVCDGEEWQLTGSDSLPAISSCVGLTDATTLRFRDPSRFDARGKPAAVGSVFLVHGNGRDVMADWSDNSGMAALLAPALALADEMAVAHG